MPDAGAADPHHPVRLSEAGARHVGGLGAATRYQLRHALAQAAPMKSSASSPACGRLLVVVGVLELTLPAGKLTTFGGSFIVDDLPAS
jgi:hypothetical protein